MNSARGIRLLATPYKSFASCEWGQRYHLSGATVSVIEGEIMNLDTSEVESFQGLEQSHRIHARLCEAIESCRITIFRLHAEIRRAETNLSIALDAEQHALVYRYLQRLRLLRKEEQLVIQERARLARFCEELAARIAWQVSIA